MKLLRIALALTAFFPVTAFAQTPTSDVYAFTRLIPPAYVANGANGMNTFFNPRGIAGEVTVGTGFSDNPDDYGNALRWNADTTVTNLHTLADLGTTSGSAANGVSGAVTVGWGFGANTQDFSHALRWNADNTVTDLHNRAVSVLGTDSGSYAHAIGDGVVVGRGFGDNVEYFGNALRWNTDGTVTNLHSRANLGADSSSTALSIANGVIVGNGFGSNTEDSQNALRWNTDGTVTNLHTLANLGTDSDSYAQCVADGITVGRGSGSNTGGFINALRWNADNTVVPLHDFARSLLGTFASSYANAVAGGVTVGFGFGNNTAKQDNALRWNANGSALNLHQFVPNESIISQANAIDAETGIIAGRDEYHAALWTPLNAGVGGANSLTVAAGVTTTINRDFTQSAGSTTVNGTLEMIGNTFTLVGGTLSGAGSVDGNAAVTGGTLSPGNSAGTFSITGNFAMSGGIITIELASLSSFDRITVGGTATFTGGSLAVALTGGYLPEVGDAFDIVTTGAGLTSANTVTVPAGYTFTQSGNAGRLTFVGATVVPESGTLSLLLSALGISAGSFVARRRFAD